MRKFTLLAATALAVSLAGAAFAQTPPAQVRSITGEGASVRPTTGEGASVRKTAGEGAAAPKLR